VDRDGIALSIANDVREIAGVAERIDAFCEARALGAKTAYAVNLSIEEIVTNTIGYGYDDDEPHRIEIALCASADALVVTITDDSREFDLSQPPPEVDFEASLDERTVGGLGLFLVHELMDGVEYRRVGRRNIVTLTKKLADPG